MTVEPVAQPLVGFRRWGCRRGALYSGIFVAGRFVPNWSPRASSRCHGRSARTASRSAVECERGFRAQFARPLALLDRHNPDDYGERGRRTAVAAQAYGIPLLAHAELVAYAGWHGELRA